MGITESWLQKHHESFVKATMHPFILTIKQGTINPSSFETWLAQDYIFVREFVPFVASVLLKACKEAGDPDGHGMETVLGGLASLHDEMSWFKKEALKWGVPNSSVIAGNLSLVTAIKDSNGNSCMSGRFFAVCSGVIKLVKGMGTVPHQ